MIRQRFATLILMFACLACCSVPAAEPVRLVFDTDMGNDIDDALALATIHALESRGECKLLAVTITKGNPFAAPFVDLVNTFYGRGDIPIGAVRDGKTPKDSPYIRQPSEAVDNGRPRYPHDLKSGADAPEAVALLRKVLAGQADGSVVMVQVGFFTNFARLLDSKPDAVAPVDGKTLVRQKVRLLSVMAGSFNAALAAKRFSEYNVKIDLPASTKLFAEWPGPIVASGYEIGEAIKYPARSIENDYGYVKHHPIREAYGLYQKMPYDRQTWDLTSVLCVVRPGHGYFDLSPAGRITVDAKGATTFHVSPDGQHRYLIAGPEQVVRVREALELLSSQPPR